MKDCCDKSIEIAALKKSHGKVLWTVLAINAVMFFVEIAYGIMAHSSALLADSLDMLGDALVYGFSLLVLSKSGIWQARASLLKGGIMLVFGIVVLAEAFYKAMQPVLPTYEIMGGIGFLALSMNAICFFLLWKHRSDNINMSSTWACSRNDLIANIGVIVAAAGTYATSSKWPDLAVGLVIATVVLRSALSVISQSRLALQEAPNDLRAQHDACCGGAERV